MLFSSPLLALACAATLLVACAASPPSKAKCSSIIRGQQTILKISQKQRDEPVGIVRITIENDCLKSELDLAGEVVTACSDVAPMLMMDPWPAYSTLVVDSGDSTMPISIDVDQYCKTKS